MTTETWGSWCNVYPCEEFFGAFGIEVSLWFVLFASYLNFSRVCWSLTFGTAIWSRWAHITTSCTACCCVPFASIGGLRAAVVAPYRENSKEPSPQEPMTIDNNNAMEQGSGSATVVGGYSDSWGD